MEVRNMGIRDVWIRYMGIRDMGIRDNMGLNIIVINKCTHKYLL